MSDPSTILPEELQKGYLAFQEHERRDAMYNTATFLVEHFWGNPRHVADSLGVLLLTWNQGYYRYGSFDFNQLERCISGNEALLHKYRERDILSYSPNDDSEIRSLFLQFLEALRATNGKSKTPVGTVKALHLLAPRFFPLWDEAIAKAYKCHYNKNLEEKYLKFFRITHRIATDVHPHVELPLSGKTLLKLIDEYNYAKYTRAWIPIA